MSKCKYCGDTENDIYEILRAGRIVNMNKTISECDKCSIKFCLHNSEVYYGKSCSKTHVADCPNACMRKDIDMLKIAVKELTDLVKYSPPTDMLPQGGAAYQAAKQAFEDKK